jgi:pleckstrin domain-containing family G protein 5
MDVDCFLFTDLILICKANRRERYKVIKPPMRLDQIIVSDLKDRNSFCLIYLNEYHIPISALTFHGDSPGVRAWLEKIREAQVKRNCVIVVCMLENSQRIL